MFYITSLLSKFYTSLQNYIKIYGGVHGTHVLGIPKLMIMSMLYTIQTTEHTLCTSFWDSSETYGGLEWRLSPHGTIQGNVAPPLTWAAVNNVRFLPLNKRTTVVCSALLVPNYFLFWWDLHLLMPLLYYKPGITVTSCEYIMLMNYIDHSTSGNVLYAHLTAPWSVLILKKANGIVLIINRTPMIDESISYSTKSFNS